jgi:hypothetical protein
VVERLRVGDIWYGKVGTAYEGIQATISRITPHRVQISFDKKVNGNLGIMPGKKTFRKLFQKKKPHIQLDFFKDMSRLTHVGSQCVCNI